MEAQKKGVRVRAYSLAIVLAAGLLSSGRDVVRASRAAASAGGPGHAVVSERVTNALDKIPLSFEANQGQTDRRVRFLSRGHGYALFLTANQAVLSLRAADQPKKSTSTSGIAALNDVPRNKGRWNALRVRLEGGNRDPAVTAIDQLPGHANYLIGNDRHNWRTNIRTYEKVKYTNVYPGIDLVYHGSSQRQLEYDFVVGAGRDPGVIELAFEGADSLRLNQQGDLIVKLPDGEIVEQRPVIYQEIDGGRRAISGGYQLKGKEVAFKLGTYDKRKPLIIDPTLAYSTFLGGGVSTGIAVDSQGNSYVTGYTFSADFPTTPGAYQTTFRGTPYLSNGSGDAFVTKLNRDGTQVIYSTFIGGDSQNQSIGIGIDGQGNAYIAGTTNSTDFPVTPSAYQPNYSKTPFASGHAFVTKLTPDGSQLSYSTFLGGSSFEQAQAIAVDSSGNAYVSGFTESSDFPTTPGAFHPSLEGIEDAFLTKLNQNGSQLVYSTFVGGTDLDEAHAMALDNQGSVYLTGWTLSADFPTTPGAYQTACQNCGNGFVTKINPDGKGLGYSTFLRGGSGQGIAVDGSGNAYVTGIAGSSDFPTTPGAFQTIYQYGHAFVTKLNATGCQLVYSTFLGTPSPGGVESNGIAVNKQGNAYVTGNTASTIFPTTPDAYQAGHPVHDQGYSQWGFIVRLNLDGSALDYSTYIGISPETRTGPDNLNATIPYAIALDCCGNAYVTGMTTWSSFPTTPGAFQTTYLGQAVYGVGTTFITKFKFEPPIITAPAAGTTVSGAVSIQTQRNPGVKWLNVYVDGTYLASSAPFTFSWDSSKYAGGEHKISALAYGYDNQESGSDEVIVTASNPGVKIDQPATGSSVSGIVTIGTERTQDVQWINVYIDGKHLASSPPFSFQWNSAKVPNGTHSISAKGYRGAGTLLGSASVTVQVKN